MASLPAALVVGGSSGLGYELAKGLLPRYDVHITGRKDPRDDRLRFHSLDLSGPGELTCEAIAALAVRLPPVSLLVYCAGGIQLGHIDEATLPQIEDQVRVGIVAPALIVKEFLARQGSIGTLLVITSTTQRIARETQPLYATSKAALGMLAESLSLDARISKTLVAGPGGMRTGFWDGTGVDASGFLEAAEVAPKVIAQLEGEYRYRHIEIPRSTGVSEIVKERK